MSNIRKIYIYVFFGNLFFERAIWMIYLMNIVGLSLLQVSFAQAILNVTMVFFEFPTGIIADRFGRKRTLMVAHILIATYLLIMGFFPSPYTIVLGFFVFGVGLSLISGTDQSLIYESLQINSNQEEYQKFMGRYNALIITALALSALIGGYLQNISWQLLFFFGIVSQLISLIIISRVKETSHLINNNIDAKEDLLAQLKSIWLFIKNNKQFRILTIVVALSQGTLSIVFLYSQPVLLEFGASTELIAIIYILLSLAMLVASLTSYKIVEAFGREKTILVMMLFAIILFIILGTTSHLLIVIFTYALLKASFEIWDTSLNAKIHDDVSANYRSSLVSFINLATALVMVLMGLLAGILNEFIPINVLFSVFGIVIMTITVVVFWNYYKKVKYKSAF